MKFKKTLVGLIVVGIFISSLLVVSGDAHAWDFNVSVYPARVTAGQTVTFHITIRNVGTLTKITKLGAKFYYGWEIMLGVNQVYPLYWIPGPLKHLK